MQGLTLEKCIAALTDAWEKFPSDAQRANDAIMHVRIDWQDGHPRPVIFTNLSHRRIFTTTYQSSQWGPSEEP